MGVQVVLVAAASQRPSQLLCPGAPCAATPDESEARCDGGSFKRRAAPAPFSGEARSGEGARTAKRLRRDATETPERGNGSGDAGRVDPGPVPELEREHPGSHGESRQSEQGQPASPGPSGEQRAAAHSRPESDEGPLLR